MPRANRFLGGATPNLLDAYVMTLYRWGGMTGIDPAGHARACATTSTSLRPSPAIAAALERERIPLHTYKPAA